MNAESLALEVIGQDWSGEVASLFLEEWELAREALSCHMALDLLCQEMKKRARKAHCHSVRKPLSPWKGCDCEERSVLREL